jgi:hypothetical protein
MGSCMNSTGKDHPDRRPHAGQRGGRLTGGRTRRAKAFQRGWEAIADEEEGHDRREILEYGRG